MLQLILGSKELSRDDNSVREGVVLAVDKFHLHGYDGERRLLDQAPSCTICTLFFLIRLHCKAAFHSKVGCRTMEYYYSSVELQHSSQ